MEGVAESHARDRQVRCLSLVVLALFAVLQTEAGAKARPVAKNVVRAAPAGPVQSLHRRSPYVGAMSLDAATGRVLFEDRADVEAYPASVSKLMTLLLVLEDVADGRYALGDRVTATAEVYKAEPSVVGIAPGQSMTVDDLLMALMVKSANDAAIALGVHASGSLDAFVARMNARAAQLGMKNTRYYNPNGLPPKPKNGSKGFNVSTCRDQAKLAMVLVRKPQVFRYTSTKVGEVTDGAGKPLKFINHNNLMVKDKLKVLNPDGSEAIDGLKTGYIDAGGSSIVLTGKRNGKRAIVIVLGSSTSKEREEQAGRMLHDALGSLSW